MTSCVIPICAVPSVPICHLQRAPVNGFSRDGDIIIGGVIALHHVGEDPTITFREKPAVTSCETFMFENFLWQQAMVFAIEEINGNTDVLRNITLGFWIHDSCEGIQRAIEGSLWMLSGQEEPIPNYQCRRSRPPSAIIGDAVSTSSILIAQILGLYKYPQLLGYIKNVQFPERFGRGRFFDEQGNPPARYDIVNWHLSDKGTLTQVKIGEYDSSAPMGEPLIINTSAVRWIAGNLKIPLSVQSAPGINGPTRTKSTASQRSLSSFTIRSP
ncbi:hypothetical protein NDU88_000604 [Pleurodeles waltl]|uniref:Receptor ligand binding region domain-containing protein n=1 Tax=Pleurodeles waltl TaxID=8319 RepID=A0AAV7KTV0_PLEWA|nr:hypothetical protein NDU88_000604 [Pleurodeles waltl]